MSLGLLVCLVANVSKAVVSFLSLRGLANFQGVVQKPSVAVAVRDHVNLVCHDQVLERQSLGWPGTADERVVLSGWLCDVVAVAAVQERVRNCFRIVVHVSSVSLDDACFPAERSGVISVCRVHRQHSDQCRGVADERVEFGNQSVVTSRARRGRGRAPDVFFAVARGMAIGHHDVVI